MNAIRSKARPEMGPGVKHAYFRGKLVMVGFGCIGQAILPLLLRHIGAMRGRREYLNRAS
jgi:homospermidine synthase